MFANRNAAALIALMLATGSAVAAPSVKASETPAGSGEYASNWDIRAAARDYCFFGSANARSAGTGANVTLNVLPGGMSDDGAVSGDASDGLINVEQFQGPGDRQIAWSAHLTLPGSVCNTNFSVTVRSTNGGLHNSQGSSTAKFTNRVDYRVAISFDGNSGAVNASSTREKATTVLNGAPSSEGDFNIDFTSVDTAQLLIAGQYRDEVYIVMRATV